ncbi:ROK family protein [Paenibacillus sp. GXUN7292]|uniref:ROK family protein n=1 Tax=Paenibacillus sp. GXUN7292 TaxID=3422499 RepID=UPI003D7C3BFF
MTKSRGRGPTIAKDINRRLVYQLIKQKRITSRVEVANELKLNKNTVNSIVDEMLAHDFIIERGPQETQTAGRKPIIIHFNASKKWAIGIQLTSTVIHWTVTDLHAKPIHSFSVPLQACTPEHAVLAIEFGVRELLRTYPIDSCIGMGIGVPGLMNAETGTIIRSSHLNWNNIPFLKLLSDKIGLPMQLDNSVKLASLGEAWHGLGQGVSNFVYCYFGNGVGCSIMMNNMILRGDVNAAGELGHIVTEPGGELCGCGNRGCLETSISLPAIMKRLKPYSVSATHQAPLDAMEWIAAELKQGSSPVVEKLDQVGEQIGQALSYVTNLLNPKLIICDGPLMEVSDYLFPIIEKQLKARSVSSTVDKLQLARSELFPLASCIGAAANVIQAWEEVLIAFD